MKVEGTARQGPSLQTQKNETGGTRCKVGNSVGVVLPKEALTHLNVGEGDTLSLTETSDGALRVTPATEGREQFARQMKAAEKIVRRYRNALRELAK